MTDNYTKHIYKIILEKSADEIKLNILPVANTGKTTEDHTTMQLYLDMTNSHTKYISSRIIGPLEQFFSEKLPATQLDMYVTIYSKSTTVNSVNTIMTDIRNLLDFCLKELVDDI